MTAELLDEWSHYEINKVTSIAFLVGGRDVDDAVMDNGILTIEHTPRMAVELILLAVGGQAEVDQGRRLVGNFRIVCGLEILVLEESLLGNDGSVLEVGETCSVGIVVKSLGKMLCWDFFVSGFVYG